MMERQAGRIGNIASIAGLGERDRRVYAHGGCEAAKAGVA